MTCSSPQAQAIYLKRVKETIAAINACLPTESGVQAISQNLINSCSTLDGAESVLALQLKAALCWLGTGGGGESCAWPSECPFFTVDTPAMMGPLFLYDARAKGFLVPNLVHASDKLYFQAGDAFENYTMSFLTDIDLPLLETINGPIFCVAQNNLIRLNMPLLTSVNINMQILSNSNLSQLNMPLLATVGGDMEISGNAITSFDQPLLTFVGNELNVATDTLASVNLDGLTTVVGDFRIESAALTSFRLPSFTSWGGAQWSNRVSGLDQATIDYVLLLLDGLGITGPFKFIDLSGGTNSPPSAAGAVAAANLIGRGVNVTTN